VKDDPIADLFFSNRFKFTSRYPSISLPYKIHSCFFKTEKDFKFFTQRTQLYITGRFLLYSTNFGVLRPRARDPATGESGRG